MPKLSDAARLTSPDGAVWRTCPDCSTLAPLPPMVEHCDVCCLGPAPTVAAGGEAR